MNFDLICGHLTQMTGLDGPCPVFAEKALKEIRFLFESAAAQMITLFFREKPIV